MYIFSVNMCTLFYVLHENDPPFLQYISNRKLMVSNAVPLSLCRFKWDSNRDSQLPRSLQKHPNVQGSSNTQAEEAQSTLQVSRVWWPGGVSRSRVWGGNLGSPFLFILFFRMNRINHNPTMTPPFGPFIKCGESTAFRVLQVQGEHCQSFTTASLSPMACKNQTKTKEKGHLSPHQNIWIKGKVESGHKLSSETKSTNWSLSEEWAVETEDLLFVFWGAHPPLFILDPVSFHIYYIQWTRQ